MATLTDLHIASLRAAGAADRTIQGRRELLRRADKDSVFELGVELASRDEIETYLGREGWAANTRASYYSHLNGFYGWAVEAGKLTFNPMDGMRRAKAQSGIPHPITDGELLHILSRADDQFYLVALLAAAAGLRCCEIALLAREDVTETVIWIRRGKGGKAGCVDTAEAVWSAVQRFRPGNLIEQTGGLPKAGWVSNLGVRRCRSLGLTGVSLHRLRHWHGTAVMEHRGNLLTAQAALRHRSVATTQGYALLRNPERRAAIRALPVIGQVLRPTG
jgi:integrase/recombinase XerD